MPRLILLTEPSFKDLLAPPFAALGLDVALAPTLASLEKLLKVPEPTRVLSVGGDFIVPERILQSLNGPAYNLHPGPPEYPGIFPSVFALYERARAFGITFHEMAPKVDSGPIVAVDRFDIAPAWDRLLLDTATFDAIRTMLERHAHALADFSKPLARAEAFWSGEKRTRKDFDALCRLPENADAQEFAHRYRAIGEGPEHAITLSRFGRTFQLISEARPIVRAGQRID